MSTRLKARPRFGCRELAIGTLLAVACASLPAQAQTADRADSEAVGRVEFDFSDAPAATVEVDLKEGMLSAFTGIGKAAVQGVVEALAESRPGSGNDAVQRSTEHLQSIDDILQIVGRVIREVRLRVYEDVTGQTPNTHASMVEHYQTKLDGTDWENVVRVRDSDDSVVVCVLQQDVAIRGLFIMVSDRDDLILVNVVCNLTPENVKQLATQATRIGMEAGLEDVIEEAMREIGRGRRR